MSTRVALITGALTGIGRATAFAFAKEGSTVVVSGRREAEGRALESELRNLGAEAAFMLADVRHEDQVHNLVDQTVERFGRLDIAVNNAGTEGKPGPLTEQTSDSYAGTFDTNVLGTLLSLMHELRVMLPQGSGSIINISSTMGERGAANLETRIVAALASRPPACQSPRRRRASPRRQNTSGEAEQLHLIRTANRKRSISHSGSISVAR
jgi:NAD(P)-dependent dehydrogenase (short-subunit alcohol dehydrogenase family)